MRDIKLSEIGNIDYIPKDSILCEKCINWDNCPYTYICPTLDRLIEFKKKELEEL